MKITKYPQSCLLVETGSHKILVDPGELKYQEAYLDAWRQADCILVTHKHSDHIHHDALKAIDLPIYSTAEVQAAYPDLKISLVKAGDTISLETSPLTIEITKAIHGYNPYLKNGGEVFENVGYIIDDGQTRLYATSDTICFNNDYRADVVALPVTGYGLTMSSFEAALLAGDLGAKLVLPVHMDNPRYPTDLDLMRKNFDEFSVNYQLLAAEESIEI